MCIYTSKTNHLQQFTCLSAESVTLEILHLFSKPFVIRYFLEIQDYQIEKALSGITVTWGEMIQF